MKKEEITKLAELSRLHISEEEIERFQIELESIITYVEQVQDLHIEKVDTSATHSAVSNVFRDDANPHEPKVYTSKVLDEAPQTKEGYIQVKKIL